MRLLNGPRERGGASYVPPEHPLVPGLIDTSLSGSFLFPAASLNPLEENRQSTEVVGAG